MFCKMITALAVVTNTGLLFRKQFKYMGVHYMLGTVQGASNETTTN